MKTRFFTIMVALFAVALSVQSQNEAQTAVLQTGDEVKVYNGVNALKNALAAAAETGSVITLSDGTFNNPGDIKKSVCIYGNGWEEDAEQGIKPSIIDGDLTITSGSTETSLEGIRLEGFKTGYISASQTNGMIISKCQFGNFNIGANLTASSVRQCYFGSVTGSKYVALDIQNCILTGRMTYDNANAMLTFDHCVLSYRPQSSSGYNYNHYKAIYTNSIILMKEAWYSFIADGSTVKHCIMALSSVSGMTEGNWYSVDLTTLFENGTNLDYSPTSTYVLVNPATYVGTDGTEVGIHGGNYPWAKIPASPVVKKLELNVSGKTLNVNYDAEVR